MLEVACVVSGSFPKAKERIDQTIQCFRGNGIRVLSPDVGGLYHPPPDRLWTPGSYPLETELRMAEREVKLGHVLAITRADFVYFVLPSGYLGESGAFEVGIAYACGIPIYADESPDPSLEGGFWEAHIKMFQVKSPEEVARIWRGVNKPIKGLWLPAYLAYEIYARVT